MEQGAPIYIYKAGERFSFITERDKVDVRECIKYEMWEMEIRVDGPRHVSGIFYFLRGCLILVERANEGTTWS